MEMMMRDLLPLILIVLVIDSAMAFMIYTVM